jgi:hypothetical protein
MLLYVKSTIFKCINPSNVPLSMMLILLKLKNSCCNEDDLKKYPECNIPLRHNRIKNLDNVSLSGLVNLGGVNLVRDHIRFIRRNVFQNTPSLQLLRCLIMTLK